MATQRIAIVGGGPGGLMLARLLQRQGKCPVVLERDRHAEERPQGGSLDMHSESGQYAMERAGLREAFMVAARPEDQGDRLYNAEGKLLFDRNEPTDDRPEIDRSVLRPDPVKFSYAGDCSLGAANKPNYSWKRWFRGGR